jgi:hypothetical protein
VKPFPSCSIYLEGTKEGREEERKGGKKEG